MIPQDNFVFAKNVTSAYTPKSYINNKCDIMCIEISGTFTSGSFIVEGKTDVNNENYTPIAAIGLSALDLFENGEITAKGIYEVSIEGLHVIRVRTASVSGGYVNIIGRVVTEG